MRIGVLGGTFNPVHIAHLRIAEEVRESFDLEKVIFVPSATPPHKPLAGDLPFEIRHEMVKRAIKGNPAFAVSDIEGKRGGKSYSIDTIHSLRAEYPDNEFFFIVGSDSFLDIGTWRKYSNIFALCNIVVVERPGAAVTSICSSLPFDILHDFSYFEAEKRLAHKSGYSVYYAKGVPLEISSTAVRRLARLGRSIRFLVPEAVELYIKEQRLYT
ncbi:MAG TPA: nicotinate-nucleotide adenylyltransferase [Geobacteraceae bacterium]|nr:nicotinate-nucleotide adenylyltransferase [Geobacteraceae bacterium]